MGAYKRKRPIRLPTDRQLARLLNGLTARNQLILILAWKMGLRRAEIAGLKCSDLHLGEKPALSFVGKGGKPAVLPITDEVLGYLERALRERPNLPDDSLIWNSRGTGAGLSNSGLNYIFSTSGARAGLKLYPHLLRHRFATNVYEKSGDINAVKIACRHSRLSTAADVYTHTGIQREVFEQLDSRSWLARVLSKLKPARPAILASRKAPTFTGETIGRQAEIARLKANHTAGIHTVLCGPRGSGKSHLLRLVAGPGVYRLDDLKPPKERLAELVEQMRQDGTLADNVAGKSTNRLLKSLLSGLDGKPYVLVIDTLDAVTPDGIALLRKLKGRFTILAAIDEKNRARVKEIFFGGCEVMEISHLPAAAALHLADAASADVLTTPDSRERWLKRVVAESRGSPQAVVEIVDRERRRGRVVDADAEIVHEATQEPLPATLILSALALLAVVSRYGASSVGLPDWKIILIAAVAVVIVLVLIDRVLRQGARQ